MKMKQRIRHSHAFTMLEMLTVLTIIAVLAGLLFPMIQRALRQAEVAKAQQAVNSLATAFKAYYTEYGKWPIADTAPPYRNYIVDGNFVALLQGKDAPYAATPTIFGGGNSGTFQGNSRQTPFLEFKRTDIDGSGNFVDPWGRPYLCRFDVNYQNWIENPFFLPATGNTVTNGFLIWSAGPDGQYDQSGDPGTGANKDNVKSW